MTRENLEHYLAKIGWRIEKSWNGLNDYIINHLNEKTRFVVSNDKIEVRSNLFGGDTNLGKGMFSISLEACSLKSGSDNPNKTEWISIEMQGNYILMCNHEL